MLDIRTNILLDKARYEEAVQFARQHGVSFGEYVRQALDERVGKEREQRDDVQKRREAAVLRIRALQKKIKPLPKGVTIRDLIEWGRKY